MSSVPAPLAGGRYVPERILGEGGRKRVWLARDTRLDRPVAVAIIKTEGLDANGLARIKREAQAMARLGDHPNVVAIYDIGDEAEVPYIVSQYISGGSLEERLARDGRLPVSQAVHIAVDVLRALAHAHHKGIVHRDLKPGNIWLTEDGTAKLGDFGLALDRANPRLTVEGQLLGTATYMAPEQALGHDPDPRSDLYALGGTLYEMITGRPPFIGDDTLAVVSQHINTAPVAPSWHNPEVPAALEALIMALLAKSPDDRPAEAESTIDVLAGVALEEAGLVAVHGAPNPLDRLASGVFVGREREMHDLVSALDDALVGRGHLVLLVGEPGIGKTRMAEQIATLARTRRTQVLWGRCYEGEGAPPFWPWLQALRSYVHERDADALRSELGTGAGAIAQLVTEVHDRLGPLEPPPQLEPEQARFRLFDAITTFLRGAAVARPIVLVLDDLHWADAPSLLLLQFLARELRDARILVVGTYRDVELGRRHPLAQALGELARERLSSRVLLRGFSSNDVGRFIEAAASASPPPGLVAAVTEHTEGNPFFVSEVVRLLVAEGRLDGTQAGAWSVDIPQGVREVVGRRLDHLSEECNEVLAVASVAGREFDIDLLAELIGRDIEALSSLLDEGVSARLVVEAPRPLGRYTFSHALIRQTLYEELSPARRALLHRRIADAIERTHPGRVDARLAELAHHTFQAAAAGDDIERAVRYASAAAAQALDRFAFEEAVRLYDVALQAMDLAEVPDAERRCDLLLALGDAQWKAGETARARQTLALAANEARTVGSPPRLARAALGFGGVWIHIGRVDEDRIRLMEEALAGLGSDGEHVALRARLLARLAIELYYSDARERRNALSHAAVKLARSSGDRETLAYALSARHFAVWGPENANERLELADEIVALARSSGAPELELAGHAWRITDLLEIGDMAAVDAALETHARLANDLRQPLYLYFTTGFRATRALMSGDFVNGERLAGEALKIARRARATAGMQTWGVQLFAMRRAQGRLAELEPLLAGLVEQYGATIPGWRAVYAAMLCEIGRLDDGRAIVDDLAAEDFAGIHRDANWIVGMCALALATGLLGDTERAARVYELLRPYGGVNLVVGWPAMCYGPTDAYLAVGAATMRRFGEAEEHFKAAIAMDEKIGARPWLANVQTEYARMLIARDEPGDRNRALALLSQALGATTAIGMPGLAERALLLKLTLQGVASRDPTSSIDTIAGVVVAERVPLGEGGTPPITIAFSDIEGFTNMVERHGDALAQVILRDHNAIVRAQVGAAGGVVVRSLGDGFMMSFPGPAEALRAAVGIQHALDDYNIAPPLEPIHVRLGMHTGEAILEGDDFFGRNVILAARIAAQASGGEILVSGLVRDLLAPGGEFVFAAPRKAELKGLAGTHELVPVLWLKT
jgi:class 3 adenylate cyclase